MMELEYLPRGKIDILNKTEKDLILFLNHGSELEFKNKKNQFYSNRCFEIN